MKARWAERGDCTLVVDQARVRGNSHAPWEGLPVAGAHLVELETWSSL